ncbi:MAG: hypothetical protein P1V18_03340 [Candidatus Gracilibacteria bacterium]|nr:hypothetical protein [Candidatus Gracilibacteria bacterium]
MKKALSITFAIMLISSLSACSWWSSEEETSTASEINVEVKDPSISDSDSASSEINVEVTDEVSEEGTTEAAVDTQINVEVK